MKATYILIMLLAVVVAAGVVYLSRPLPNEGKISSGPPLAVNSPVDNTVPWPPQPSGVPFHSVSRVVRVTLKTSKGNIVLALDGPRAAFTVGNFVHLAESNFYDGTTFHRVIPGFMIQGGDPVSRDASKRELHGRGGPGYSFPDEMNERKLVAGTIAMANAGPNTNGSQFFIVTAPELPRLDGKHTAFGVVEQGMDIVTAISGVERDENDNPLEPVIIQDVIVHDETESGGLKVVK